MRTAPNPYEVAARMFEPKQRRYLTPGTVAARLDPGAGTTAALEKIDQALIELADSRSLFDALAIYMPSQEGKSERVSRRYPEWLLDHDPSLRIADVSYADTLAVRWGRAVRRDIQSNPCRNGDPERCREDCGGLHVILRPDSAAAGWWETTKGGGMYSVGIGGGLTGLPVDFLIVDDPLKDRIAAESAKIRENAWDWWESVALTRLAARPKVVLVMTRWHTDDLAGRIMSRPGPLRWRELRIPAIAENDDPIGRSPGEELPSVRKRDPGYFLTRRATMSAYVFSAMYQQHPVAAEGNFFRRPTYRFWRPLAPWADGRERIDLEGTPVTLTDAWTFITMDFAASVKTSAHYTVASAWAVSLNGDQILLDRRRKRVEDHEHFALARPLLARWPGSVIYAEANFWSKTFMRDAEQAGVAVAPLTADVDKVTRAIPAAGRLHAGKVWFPAETSGCECGNCPDGNWIEEWCDELAAFPNGTFDDQVDTFSYAGLVVTTKWTPAPPPERPGLSLWEQSVNAAVRSATGDGDRPLDPFDVPW